MEELMMNKSEVIEMASKMTREEFLYENAKYNGSCPHISSPQQEECNVVSDEDAKECCMDCWSNALNKDSDIKFKDEEIIEQPKEYIINDIINDFKEETLFLSEGIKYKIYKGNLFWNPSGVWSGVGVSLSLKQILEMKFTKVEEPKLKPMTFEEAVHTLKKVKYEFFNDKQDKFYPPNETIQSIIELYPIKTTAIILEGTWFAEGVYE
jgi:hypothetical protein